MEETDALQIGLEALCPGKKVNVKWLGQCFEGTVVSLGPQRKLCKVVDSTTEEAVLMDPSLLKPIDQSLPTHQQLSTGAQVAFYDNDEEKWVDGTIENDNAQGMVLVKWKGNRQANFTTSWFELQDVAITIQNEAFGITAVKPDGLDDELHPIPSLEDVLEERPRHTTNEAYQDPPSPQKEPFQDRFSSLDSALPDYRIKPIRTSSSMKHMYTSKQQMVTTTPDRRSATLQRSPSDMTSQYALLRGKLDHSSRPAVWSYRSRTNGIPPHPTSKFFRNVSQNTHLPSLSALIAPAAYAEHSPTATLASLRLAGGIRRTHSAMLPLSMHRSPTVVSDVRPESATFAEHLTSSSGPGIQQLFQENQRRLFSNRPLPDPPVANNPYEVPITHNPLGLAQLPEKQMTAVYSEVGMPTSEIVATQAPRIESSSPPEVVVEVGSSAILSCQVSSATPPKYEWRKNGHKLSHNDEHIATPAPGMLQLYSVTSAQTGRYECLASNGAGSVTYTCQLTVKEGKTGFGGDFAESTLSKSEATEPDQKDAKWESEEGTQRNTVPVIYVEDTTLQTEVKGKREGKQVKSKSLTPKKHRDHHKLGQVTFSDMDHYLEGYGEDYGALSTQSDIFLPQEDEEEIDVGVIRQLRFGKQGRKTSREEQFKSRSASDLEDQKIPETGKHKNLFLLQKLRRPKRVVETSTTTDPGEGEHQENTPQGDHSEHQGSTGNEAKPTEGETMHTQLRPACSRDSMDAHMSYESSSSKSDAEESGGVQLPLAEQHYTEGIRKLQLSREAYEEEHFGKSKPKKRGLLRRFSSKSKKNKKVTFI